MSDDVKAARVVTRCYITDAGFVLRTKGATDIVVPMPDVDTNVRTALACEMTALLLLRGETMADIVAGKGIPDRSLPAPAPRRRRGRAH